jgi:hypothetical protein
MFDKRRDETFFDKRRMVFGKSTLVKCMVSHFYIVCVVPCVHVFLLKIKRILMYEFYSCLPIRICLNEIEYLLNFFDISLQIQLGFTMNADAFKTKTKCRAIAPRSNSSARKRPVPVILWKKYPSRKIFR